MGNLRICGSVPFAGLAAAGGHTAGLVIGASVIVLTALVPVVTQVITELFWLRALNKPERELHWALDHAASVGEAERLMRILRCGHRDVLRARIEASKDSHR
ncbi:hypothetical protein [Nocardia tenerifensis]|uniref:hypothetical protein n=1 Tax=Nocardia tenerifensis TaxID=228006 RepID=UPI0005937FFF|nr:hypothetical protein [Nocardia tenerifensis]